MRQDTVGRGALDYRQCNYGLSRLAFRGPRHPLAGRYAAFVGGTETFGKFMQEPLPAIAERLSGVSCANFGCVNAGIGAFADDAAVLAACHDAVLTVIEVTGAHNISNRFYKVHPRRNDRFLKATPLLREIYDEVDFADFTFTRHLLSVLCHISPTRFRLVRRELRRVWLDRMRDFIAELPAPPVLLWYRDTTDVGGAGPDPLLVTDALMAEIAPLAAGIVRVDVTDRARADGQFRMVFGPAERAAAAEMLGPAIHETAARALVPILAQAALRGRPAA
ncbi:DUF6473 family protein [Pelagovum pacificum]|uniref:DUF6473 domain-containing protein n=1 Tax=Pelagovum pacificum TaxID=2588711 RepID=A0A5C5GBM9_9RHOB|nr:DUF6473 family protein [Pelagovum pacificum]QQA42298.1 hypothetical protein I8N54_16110 [Pelagovum pacificum]TNY31382.1 hypothetical protein FHY64_15300 [Pelagovum pacificum]